jgi:two-component system KDP operon response regulator KdpE
VGSQSILIIGLEDQIRKILTITLQSNGFYVTDASTVKAGLAHVAEVAPDLMLLDLNLPDASGHGGLKYLRDRYANPIIIISVLNSEEEISEALNNGADDFLIRPFRTEDLLSRIQSALKNVSRQPNSTVLTFHDLTIDLTSKTIQKHDYPITFTPLEYSLLTLLAHNEGKVLTHQYLLKEGLGSSDSDSQFLKALIADIRKKIETDPDRPTYIITERGVGYRFIGNMTITK